jgi:hypothetical protein
LLLLLTLKAIGTRWSPAGRTPPLLEWLLPRVETRPIGRFGLEILRREEFTVTTVSKFPAKSPPKTGRPSPWLAIILILIIGAAAAVLVNGIVSNYRFGSGPILNPDAAERPSDPKTAFDLEEKEAIQVFKDARESVVNVDTVASSG